MRNFHPRSRGCTKPQVKPCPSVKLQETGPRIAYLHAIRAKNRSTDDRLHAIRATKRSMYCISFVKAKHVLSDDRLYAIRARNRSMDCMSFVKAKHVASVVLSAVCHSSFTHPQQVCCALTWPAATVLMQLHFSLLCGRKEYK
jgi:hypothetical protein